MAELPGGDDAARGCCLAAFLLAAVAFLGCGRQGPPLPPLKIIPLAAGDLTVRQQGAELILECSYPLTTTSGAPLPALEIIEVWEVIVPLTGNTPERLDAQAFGSLARLRLRISRADLPSVLVGDRIVVRLPIPDPLPSPPRGHHLAVRTRASEGEWSAFSNQAVFVPQPPPAPPRALTLTPQPTGVEIAWTPAEGNLERFHVYRRQARETTWGPPLAKVPPDQTQLLDVRARYGETYVYTVTAAVSEEPLVESSPTDEAEILYQDRFPPPAPADLLALPESSRVRLLWSASAAPDVAGYHVYRKEAEGELQRLTAEPVQRLEFTDPRVRSGSSYLYRVSAVDRRGQEGPLGEPVRIRLQ